MSGSGKGRAVPVYDGRTWPVVKCGAVYVTDNDKTKTVTKNVVSLSSADERKVKTSKYTLAIGSSFGHVHGFLKDTDHVLKALDKYKVEDKCLMLIKKPKSASKQMLKAHSWANLNVSDIHQRNPDGSVKPDLLRTSKEKGPIKARPADLSLSLPTEAKLLGLSKSLLELGESESKSLGNLDNKTCDQLQKQNKKKDLNVPNIYSPYPVSSQTKDKTDISSLSVDESEVTRKMGQGYSTTVEGQVQLVPQNANSARSLPPTVPNTNKLHSNKKKGHPNARHSQSEADKYKNRSLSRSKSDSDENMLYIHTKHDSGFYSATQLSREEMYDYGFKKDLEMDSGNMTSSPRAKGDLQSPERSVSKNTPDHVISKETKEKTSRMKPEGQTYKRDQGQQGQGRQNQVGKGSHNGFYTLHGSVENLHCQREQPSSANKSNNHAYEMNNKENIQKRYGSKLQLELSPGQKEQPSQGTVVNQQAPSNSSYSDREVVMRKSATDVKDSIKISIENGEPVLRAKSLGDLQTGCAFSIVGQRKSENDPVNEPEEFTGSKMTAYYRKIREMKRESKHGSLPFRGRNVDLEGLSQVAEKMESQMQQQTGNQPKGFVMKTDRPKHYSSLQHLPMSESSYSNTERESRHVVPTRKHIKTPMKPKRCLPQVPADTDQKKRQVTDVMKVRMSAGSQSSSSPSSSQSNRAGSSEGRYGFPPNTTPADREVSDLLDNPHLDNVDHNEGCMNNNVGFVTNPLPSKQILPSELYSHPAIDSINNSMNLHATHPNQHLVSSTGGRLSESGQTTLTSQSTIDSGYATNDPDHEMIPTSIYAKSLKQSAQSLYKSNKLLKPSKDLSQAHVNPEYPPTQPRGLNPSDTSTKESQLPKERTPTAKRENYQVRHAKDIHTQNWVNKLQSSGISVGQDAGPSVKDRHQYQSMGNLSLQGAPKQVKMDNNNNSARHSMTQLTMGSMSESYPQDYRAHVPDLSKVGTYPPKRQQLSHHPSELSVKDIERMNQEHGQIRSKGKSLSMSQGLNLIDSSKDFNHGLSLTRTHPKFTGSLKDLIGVGKQIVPVEILKREDFHQSTGTLFTANNGQQESSLKSLGKPSLFQVLQNYNLYTVRMQVPEHFSIVDNIRMIECEVVLPSSYIFGGETPLSPKGNYAKLGGPNSAFRPVVSGVSTVKTVSMVTVLDVSNELAQTFHTGQIKKGDLIVELNERLMIGEELSTLTAILKSYKGEVILTVARDKARETQQFREKNSGSPTNADFRLMEQKIVELTKTLQKRDRTIQKLNAFLPWQSPSTKGQNSESNIEPIISNLNQVQTAGLCRLIFDLHCPQLYNTTPAKKDLKSLPHDKNVDLSKLKAFADDNSKVAQVMEVVFDRVENIVGKGENAGSKLVFQMKTV